MDMRWCLTGVDEKKGGLLWYPGDSDSDSLNPALNAAMLLTRYAQIATTQDKAKSYLVRPSPPSISISPSCGHFL
jgi:hypothetical protein